MISEGSIVKIIDNSGAVEGKCIKVIWPKSGHGRRIGREGDIIVVSILKTIAGSRIKKGDVRRGLIVRTVYKTKGSRTEREDIGLDLIVKSKRTGSIGHRQTYEDNSIILVKMGTSSTGGGKIKKRREVTPVGTRARGPLGFRIRINKNNSKVTAII